MNALRWQQSPKFVIFSIKVTVNVTRSLTLVLIERVSLVEYACQIWSLYLLQFKSYRLIANVTFFATESQTESQIESHLSIESHFVSVHGAIWIASERIAKLNAPRKRCMKICYSFPCNSYGLWTQTKCDSILIFTSFHNKVCHDIAYCNTKKSYLSDFQRTKSKTLRTAK